MKVVVGLGNPGPNYSGTRHNVGYEVLTELAQRWSADRPKQKFEADLRETQIHDQRVLLVAPLTYMNLSGRCVQPLLKFYQIPVEDVLVVCDDMNLKLGQIRLRANGSAGGQKGLANIIQVLGTDAVPRLRMGIDRPPGTMDGASYVLARFRSEERPDIDEAVKKSADATELWISKDLATAMNQYNGSGSGEKSTEAPPNN